MIPRYSSHCGPLKGFGTCARLLPSQIVNLDEDAGF